MYKKQTKSSFKNISLSKVHDLHDNMVMMVHFKSFKNSLDYQQYAKNTPMYYFCTISCVTNNFASGKKEYIDIKVVNCVQLWRLSTAVHTQAIALLYATLINRSMGTLFQDSIVVKTEISIFPAC